MRKIILAGAAVTLMFGPALAQTSTAHQGDNMNKQRMHNGATYSGSMGTTTGQGRGDPNGGNPNGNANGPTSLSGTGSSTYGGVGTPGTSSGR